MSFVINITDVNLYSYDQISISAFLYYIFSAVGITAGAHRLWSHKSYRARTPLKILLAFMQTAAFQVLRDVALLTLIIIIIFLGYICVTHKLIYKMIDQARIFKECPLHILL